MENAPTTPAKLIPTFSRLKNPVAVLGGSSPNAGVREVDRFGELVVDLDGCGTNQENYVDHRNSEKLTECSHRKRQKRDAHMNEQKPIEKTCRPKVAVVGDIKKSAESETLQLSTPKKGSHERSSYVWKINQEVEGSSDFTPEPVQRLFTEYLKTGTTLQSNIQNEAKNRARHIHYQNLKHKEINESQKTNSNSEHCAALVAASLGNQPKDDSTSRPIILYQRRKKALSLVTKKRQEGLPISTSELISRDQNGHGTGVEQNIVVEREEGSLVCCDGDKLHCYLSRVKEQRNVLSRVKDFIAIMHNIQGDRSFSAWTCSVVDSVVGGFLTQNTTDHSSSSAFMCLAAKFPCRPRADCHTSCIDNGAVQQNKNPANCQIVEKSVDVSQVSCLATKTSKTLFEKNQRKRKFKRMKDDTSNLKNLWKTYGRTERKTDPTNSPDIVDWEKVRKARVTKVAAAIKTRGQQRRMAQRIKAFLDDVVKDLGVLDLEWLKDIPPAEAKDYLLNVFGLGLKSVECISLLSLHHKAFPVDTNVQRVAVRLGWIPLETHGLPFHLLREYPSEKTVQEYLWQRLCRLDHSTLFELHYHAITFGKVFCTNRNPNCTPCPMKGQCSYFASKEASCSLSLPELREGKETLQASARSLVQSSSIALKPVTKLLQKDLECTDIEDLGGAFHKGSQKMTVYELPDDHYVLKELEEREPGDLCPYLLVTWPTVCEHVRTKLPGMRITPVRGTRMRNAMPYGIRYNKGLHDGTSFDSVQDQNLRTIRATILIPCRTATKGRFPLSGTYFQINEVFADHETSERPINVLVESIQNLEKRWVFVGADISSIFRDQTQEDIRYCFQQGFVCSRGFDRITRMPEKLCQRFFASGASSIKKSMKRKRSLD